MICVVCQDSISSNSVLSCGHFFHGQCIADWLWLKQNCPSCRFQSNNVREEDSREDLSSEDNEDEVQFRNRKERRRKLINIMRRKSFQSGTQMDTIRKQIQAKKDTVKTARSQLRIMNTAISANNKEYRKQETGLRRQFQYKIRQVKHFNRINSKDFYNQVKHLENRIQTSMNVIDKLEDKLLDYNSV